VIAPQIESYAEAGCALVVFSDPFLTRAGRVEELGTALRELPARLPFVLQLPFGDAGPLLAELVDLPVQAIGVDFYATSLESLPPGYPKEIVAGVVDARSSAIERPDDIATFVAAVLQRKPAGLSLSPNGDLQFVPEVIAREKILRLGQAQAALEEAA
jgi:hypothetical protein